MLVLLAIVASCTAYSLIGALVARLAVVNYVNTKCNCKETLEEYGNHKSSCPADLDKGAVAVLSLLLWPLAVFVPIFRFILQPTLREKSSITKFQLKEMEKEVEKLKKEYNL